MSTKRPESPDTRWGHPTKGVRPEPDEGLFSDSPSVCLGRSNSPDFPRCTFAFADGRRCALPAHPKGDGFCYPHAHSPHRRLRPSDLTRELTSPSGGTLPDAKIHRFLDKLPAAVADGTISPSDARQLQHLCHLMLQCSRMLSATKLPTNTDDPDFNFVASLLDEDD